MANPVLFIDDDLDERELMAELFAAIGAKHPLLCFGNGYEALDWLRQATQPPLLIISDLKMPEIDGPALQQAILADAQLAHLHIPLVLLSLSVSPAVVKEARQAGVQAVFCKPHDFEEMKKVVAAIYQYWVLAGCAVEGSVPR